MIEPMVILGIFDGLAQFFGQLMIPLYWAVSGILVGAHHLISPLTGPDSGVTWTLSILALTVVIRTLLTPLYAKQLNSSRAMQSLQPKMKELQEKYGADRNRLAMESSKLYKDEGVSPMASCLPLLIQLPIFWALFRVLNSASRGVALGHFFEVNPHLVESLSHASIFNAALSGTFWPLNQGFGATQLLALVLIVFMTAVLFFQQLHMLRRNMPPTALEGPMGQQQKMMLYMMPFMFVFAGLSMPVGVLLYWATSNVWTLVQQWIIIRNYPTPGTPAYIEWEERMIAKGKDPHAIERARQEKGRTKRRPAATTTTATDADGTPKVARQKGINRQTTASDSERQVIQRKQVRRQPRSARKKKN